MLHWREPVESMMLASMLLIIVEGGTPENAVVLIHSHTKEGGK